MLRFLSLQIQAWTPFIGLGPRWNCHHPARLNRPSQLSSKLAFDDNQNLMRGDYPQETLHHFAQWLNGWLVDWYDFELDSGWRWPNFLDHIPSSRLPQIKFSAISFQRLAFKATLIIKVWCFSDIRTTATVENVTEIWQRCTMSFTKRLLTYWLKITCLEIPSDSLKFWLEDDSAIFQ